MHFAPQANWALYESLKDHIDHLIEHDFAGLVQMLYRVDVSEEKLKQTLLDFSEKDASDIIAVMILERLALRIQTRKQYNPQQPPIDNDEERL